MQTVVLHTLKTLVSCFVCVTSHAVTLDTLRHLLCVTTLHTLETLVMCPVLHVSQLYTPALGVGVSLCVVVCRTVGTI